MSTKIDDLRAVTRDLTAASISWMDARWNEACSLLRHTPDISPFAFHRTNHPTLTHDVRGSSWYALGLLLRDGPGDRDRAVQTLQSVLNYQLNEPGTPYHGTFYRAPEEPHPASAQGSAVRWRTYDPNWRQFIGTTLAIIIDEYAAELPTDLVRRMDIAIQRAIEGEIGEGRLTPHYTNIALMRAPLDVWAGVRYSRRDWVRHGEDWAEQIYSLFRLHDAFEEYNSPTYYGPDLFALAFWSKYAPSDLLRRYGTEMQEILWRDIAQYYHAGLRNMCGPYVRAYGMDMRKYVAILGQAIWMVVGRELAPHPDPARPMGHPNDFTYPPCLAMVGVHMPPDVVSSFQRFPGEHLVEHQIQNDPDLVASAWLEPKYMLGAIHTSGIRSAGGQFHPVTIHWRLPDGDVAWTRLIAGDAVDARASRGHITIHCSGDATFQIYAGNVTTDGIGRARWTLPGLELSVEAEAEGFKAKTSGPALEVTYEGAKHIELQVISA